MLRENIIAQCRRISPDAYSEKSVCTFVRHDGIVGFIDTSGARDGSRGIAFFGNRMCVNTDGELHEIEYEKIIYTHIISSFENSFADELSVSAKGYGELRISDYSLDKSELKKLLDELRKDSEQAGERNFDLAERYAEIVAQSLAEKAQNLDAERLEKAARELEKPAVIEEHSVIEELAVAPVIREEVLPVIIETVVDIPEERSPLPKDYEPVAIPEEKIDWISGTGGVRASSGIDANIKEQVEKPESEKKENGTPKEETRPKLPEVMNGVIDRTPVMVSAKTQSDKTKDIPEKTEDKKPGQPAAPVDQPKSAEPVLSEGEMRERIENMAPDEMMEFLSETLNEINSSPDEQSERILQTVPGADGNQFPDTEAEKAPEKPVTRWEKLTAEPIWGDIYIKASQSLRQLCESGKLTMEQMEDELRERLLSAAEAFEQLTGDDSKVPKVMIPKITELKLAADNFDSYFSYGEDIAIRAMFFMLYQMLTYADRIAESPETKARLNDFFRRFGSAGIALSMLDMRV